ncbi:hypothetical protein [Cryobacterium sp. PH31-O1]|uniref:hypothetical protein n=1 Tax=Cryobacterium sp. PH31-O1 TaxID=3046306 RepID=UPI0024B89B21|nr:hypothetical protein [Cryobacterium sp. PH31-O1]MDJ0338626.1 hypothetical protein [Cryobacterium sp. PH31-O1]
MSTQETGAVGPRSGGEIAAFVILGLLLGFATVYASFIGRFLSFGWLADSNHPTDGQVAATMNLAVGGPWVIAAVVLLWGLLRLVNGKVSWPLPLIGGVLLIVNFYVCAGVVAAT